MKDTTQSTEADDRFQSAVAGIDRRTLLKLTGAATLASGFASGTAAADHGCSAEVEAEVEGTFDGVGGGRQISVMGIPARVAENATITSPTSALSFDDLSRGSFPARSENGFVGGTAAGTGAVCTDGQDFVITELFVEVAEHVVFGPVTRNDFEEGEDYENHEGDKELHVQGVNVRPVGDDRMAFSATHEDLNTPLDVGSLEEGNLASVEGYMGTDGTLYVHTLEAEEGGISDDAALNITRAEFEDGDDIRVRGTVSETDGTVRLDNNKDGAERIVYGDESVGASDAEGVGEFRFDYEEDDIDADLDRDDLGDGFVRVTYVDPDGNEGPWAVAEPE